MMDKVFIQIGLEKINKLHQKNFLKSNLNENFIDA
jgi:hypothetical protein